MARIKIEGGSIRTAGDGSGGGAITTGSGRGTSDDPQIRTTTSFDSQGNVNETHTTVTADGKQY